MSETHTCNIDGCVKQSQYLLADHDDLCRQHAVQQILDETVAWMDATTESHDND